MIKGIVCIGANGVMGKDGTMPWGDKPLDGTHFRRLTEGHTVVMGRKTFESMGSKPLPNRRNIVLNRSGAVPSLLTPELTGMRSVDEVLQSTRGCIVWIIGGSEVFKAFMPYIEEFYITTVGEDFEGDTFFPDIHADYEWEGELLGGLEEVGNYRLLFRKFTRKP